MAYSSCSINQIENEAVVAQLLREANGSLELVDMTGKFPGLNWLPGLDHWKVFDRDGRNYRQSQKFLTIFSLRSDQKCFHPRPLRWTAFIWENA